MKKMKLTAVIAFVMLAFVGCSDDKETTPPEGSIDVAIGTFKGTIDIFVETESKYDELLVVTKTGDNLIKVEPANKALGLPTKEFKVSNSVGMYIQSAPTEPNGSFLYEIDNESLVFLAKATAEGEKEYKFEGRKQ